MITVLQVRKVKMNYTSYSKLLTKFLIIMFSLLMLPAMSSASDRAHVMEEYRLGEGDVINVIVLKSSTLTKQLTITPDGKISYPIIGEIKAAGLRLIELQHYFTKELSKTIKNPQITVVLLAAYSFRIYVMGEILKPGVFQLKGPVTIIQALAMSGGFTPYAAKHKIKIVNPRFKNRRVFFNYKTFISGKNTRQNVVLKSGDTILVP